MKNPRVMASGYAAQICTDHMRDMFQSVARFELRKTQLPDHCLRRVQMNFSGIKDFQTRVDIATLSVGMMCPSRRIRAKWKQCQERKFGMPFAAMKVHYLKTLDWNNHEVACAPTILIHSWYPNGGFHKWGVPKNGGFIREHPTKMDDLGVPLF